MQGGQCMVVNAGFGNADIGPGLVYIYIYILQFDDSIQVDDLVRVDDPIQVDDSIQVDD